MGSLKQRVQLIRDASRRPRQKTGIAPSEARAIVAAHPRECDELWLDTRPADRRGAEGGVENDGRGPVASAVQVETESTDVYKPARRSDRTHTLRIRPRPAKTGGERRSPEPRHQLRNPGRGFRVPADPAHGA